LKQKNVEVIRVSIGTAAVLGLLRSKLDAEPTTAYLMTYRDSKCAGNCGFCPQARESRSSTHLLSRVTWPTYPVADVVSALKKAVEQKKIRRVCIQAINYPEVFADTEAIVGQIKQQMTVAVSVSCQPQNRADIEHLKMAGVDRLGIALDAATPTIFDKVKGKDAGGCYKWDNQFKLFSLAKAVFGEGNVSTHLIVGLGETEKEAVEVIQRCADLGVLPALFAFTPVRGTKMEHNLPPKLESYRRIQLARYLIISGKATAEKISFNDQGEITGFGVPSEVLENVFKDGSAFRTSGCPDCNRPYYNEKPSGPIYNYPKVPNKEELQKIKKELS
jgi:biotin synthase-related radical SAM superfamily protein